MTHDCTFMTKFCLMSRVHCCWAFTFAYTKFNFCHANNPSNFRLPSSQCHNMEPQMTRLTWVANVSFLVVTYRVTGILCEGVLVCETVEYNHRSFNCPMCPVGGKSSWSNRVRTTSRGEQTTPTAIGSFQGRVVWNAIKIITVSCLNYLWPSLLKVASLKPAKRLGC